LALCAFFDLLRRDKKTSVAIALFAAACLAWNPYYLLLSGTFMSDVPSLAFALIALALYARALDSGRLSWLAAATVVALAAVATRQNAIAAPLTAGVLLARSRYRASPLWLAAIGVPITAAYALHAWLSARPDVIVLRARWPEPEQAAWLCFTSLHYLGLMAAPLLVLLAPKRTEIEATTAKLSAATPTHPRRIYAPGVYAGRAVFWLALLVLGAGAVSIAIVGQAWPHEGVFPYLEDVIMARGTYVMMEGDRPPLFSWTLRLIPTALGCVCAAAWLARVTTAGKRAALQPLVLFSILQLGLLLIAPKYYDRYLLPLLVGALAAASNACRSPRWLAGLVGLGLLGGLSICLMHDWFSRNAARWELGRWAGMQQIDLNDIQGGMEWDHTYLPTHTKHYRLSLSPSLGSITVASEPYSRWLPPGKACIYLLQLARPVPARAPER
jgi:hypothetical protein